MQEIYIAFLYSANILRGLGRQWPNSLFIYDITLRVSVFISVCKRLVANLRTKRILRRPLETPLTECKVHKLSMAGFVICTEECKR